MEDAPPPPLLAEVLAEHGEFVRRLAHQLVRADEAEEVAQETLVRLLEHPPARAGNLRGWLATVTRNLVRARGRQRARRHVREQSVARPERLPSAASEVEETELLKLVVAGALELEEPYRATILALYLRGWSVERTAEAHGVRVSSVRSREQRALAHLRRKLDRHFDSRPAWIGLLLRKFEPAPPSSTLLPGARSARRALSLALSAGLVVVLWRVLAPAAPGSAPELVAAALPAALEEADLLGPAARPARAGDARAAAEVGPRAVTLTLGELHGTLLAPDGAPAAGVELELRGWPATAEKTLLHGLPEWSDLRTRSDADGHFTFRFDPPGAFQFAVTVLEERYAELGWRLSGLARGERRDLEPVQLEPAGTIEGVLVDGADRPILGQSLPVRIDVARGAETSTLAERSDVTLLGHVRRADGRFRLTRVPSGVHRVELEHPTRPLRSPPVTLAPGATVELRFPCPSLDFARDLIVHLEWQRHPLAWLTSEAPVVRLLTPDGRSLTPGADGFFRGVGPGPHRLEVEHPWFVSASRDGLEPGPARALQLEGNVALRLELVLPDGIVAAPERVRVRYPRSARRPDTFEFPLDRPTPAGTLVRGLVPGDVELAVRVPGAGERRVAVPGLAPGETRAVQLDFTRATAVRGRVQHADGTPLAGLELALLTPAARDDSASSLVLEGPPSGDPHDPWRRLQARTLTDAEGRYRFDLAAGGRFALRLQEPHGVVRASEAFAVAEDTTLERDLVVARAVECSGRVTGLGAAPPGWLRVWACPLEPELAQRHDFELATAVPLAADGRFTLSLAAGSWRLQLLLPVGELVGGERRGTQLGGAHELGCVTLREGEPVLRNFDLGSAAPVAWTFALWVNGASAAEVPLELVDAHGFALHGRTALDGRVTLWLFPGRYRPHAQCGDAEVELAEFTVEPGVSGTRRLELELASARLGFLDALGQPLAGETIELCVERQGDWCLVRGARADARGTLEFTLAPGRYGFRRAQEPAAVVPLEWGSTGPERTELRF